MLLPLSRFRLSNTDFLIIIFIILNYPIYTGLQPGVLAPDMYKYNKFLLYGRAYLTIFQICDLHKILY